MTIVRFIAGLSLLGLNAAFVSIEFALTRLRQFDKDEVTGNWATNLAWKMTEQLEIYLTACQVGITITSILLGVVFEPAVTNLIHPLTAMMQLGPVTTSWISVLLSVGFIQFLHTVWGEQSPTYIGVESPRLVAGWLSPLLYGWAWVSYPLITVGDYFAKHTLQLFGVTLTRSWTEGESPRDLTGEIGEILHNSVLDEEETREVLNTIEATERPVSEVIIPTEDVVTVGIDQTPQSILEAMRANRQYTRFPLIGEDLLDCRGILYANQALGEFKDMESGQEDIQALASSALFLEHDTSISNAVDEMQRANQEMAIVVDNDESLGIVTDSHLFEALVGEIYDPTDQK